MATTTLCPIRVFHNHYRCPECDVQWMDVLLTKGPSWCPGCDAVTEPYVSNETWEIYEGDEEDML